MFYIDLYIYYDIYLFCLLLINYNLWWWFMLRRSIIYIFPFEWREKYEYFIWKYWKYLCSRRVISSWKKVHYEKCNIANIVIIITYGNDIVTTRSGNFKNNNMTSQNNPSGIIDNICYQLEFEVNQCGYKFW